MLIQHALESVGLTIDWKWLGLEDENFTNADDLVELFERAIGREG